MKQVTTSAILLMFGQLIFVANAEEKEPEQVKQYESAEKKIRFEYPARFTVGRYDATADRTGFFTPGIVLIEKSRLGDADPQALKIGIEAITIIPLNMKDSTFWRSLGAVDAGFWKDSKVKPQKVTIGPHEATRLPGFPGPYGDNAYVYLVERPDGTIVLLMALKQFVDDARTPTGYDKTIEGIIKTMSFLK